MYFLHSSLLNLTAELQLAQEPKSEMPGEATYWGLGIYFLYIDDA